MDQQYQQDWSSSAMAPIRMMDNVRYHLNGLWALIMKNAWDYGETRAMVTIEVGLATSLFLGLDQQGTQKELEALHQKLILLGHDVRAGASSGCIL